MVAVRGNGVKLVWSRITILAATEKNEKRVRVRLKVNHVPELTPSGTIGDPNHKKVEKFVN